MRNAYKIMAGKPEGKRPHRRPTRVCGVILKLMLVIWYVKFNWFHLVKERDQ
jgi:hypothetical protein